MKSYDDIKEGEIYYTANEEDFWNYESDSIDPDGKLVKHTKMKLIDEDNPIIFEILDGQHTGKKHCIYWWEEGAAKPEDYLTQEEYDLVEGKVKKWEIELAKIEQCPQRQDAFLDQMIDLYRVANKFGFYDAADYIRGTFLIK